MGDYVELNWTSVKQQQGQQSIADLNNVEEEYNDNATTEPTQRVQFHPADDSWQGKMRLIYERPFDSRQALFYHGWLTLMIILSTLAVCIRSMPKAASAFEEGWLIIETIVGLSFFVDLIIKVWVTPGPLWRRIFSWSTFVDTVSVLPLPLELIFVNETGLVHNNSTVVFTLRLLRLLRVIRLVTMSSKYPEIAVFVKAIKRSGTGLLFLLAFYVFAGFFWSTMMFYSETSLCRLDSNGIYRYLTIETGLYENPFNSLLDLSFQDQPSSVQSIFDAMWWCYVTLTTTGFGDVVPRTVVGRLVAVMTMCSGVVFLGLPMTIFSANLTDLYVELRAERELKRKLRQELAEQQAAAENNRNSNVLRTVATITSNKKRELIVQLQNSLADMEKQLKQAQSLQTAILEHLKS